MATKRKAADSERTTKKTRQDDTDTTSTLDAVAESIESAARSWPIVEGWHFSYFRTPCSLDMQFRARKSLVLLGGLAKGIDRGGCGGRALLDGISSMKNDFGEVVSNFSNISDELRLI